MHSAGLVQAYRMGAPSAQRLSATLMDALCRTKTASALFSSAQRLSATLMDAHAVTAYTAPEAGGCSTPFGDIDGCTRAARRRSISSEKWMCSTPFGDIDGCTAPNLVQANSANPLSAQRLSATLMDALCRTLTAVCLCLASARCSTPFGDIDGCTGALRGQLPGNHRRVLNAFRRH